VANTLGLFHDGAACRVSSFTLVRFIGWLDADVVIIRAARLVCHFG
jgi:hypothetical protein